MYTLLLIPLGLSFAFVTAKYVTLKMLLFIVGTCIAIAQVYTHTVVWASVLYHISVSLLTKPCITLYLIICEG